MNISLENEHFVSFGCVRALLLIFNVFFWFAGLIMIWMGVFLETDFEDFLKISSLYSDYPPFILILTGTIILFVTTLACTCIVKTDPTPLVIYGGFLIGTLFTLISLSIYIDTYKDQVVAGITSGINQEINSYEYNRNEDPCSGNLIDSVQQKLFCCGSDSFFDWSPDAVPLSCYIDKEEYIKNSKLMDAKHFYNTGCSYKLKQSVKSNLSTIGMALSAIAFLPLFGTMLAFGLAMIANKIEYERIV